MYGPVEGAAPRTGEAATIECVRGLTGSGTLGRTAAILFASNGHLDARDPRHDAFILASANQAGEGLLGLPFAVTAVGGRSVVQMLW